MNTKAEITVFFLAHKRHRYLELIAKEIANCSEATKEKLEIQFLVDDREMEQKLVSATDILVDAGFTVRTQIRSKYLDKSSAISRSKTKYVIKHDEDIFMSSESWDYFIEAIPKYNFKQNPVIAPVISSGIPSVELFLDYFLTAKQAHTIRALLEKVKFPDDFLGADYSSLNRKYKVNDFTNFFQAVSKIPHVYKGIHPIRLSFDAQKALMRASLENISWFKPTLSEPNLTEVPGSPYFCNSFFVSKRSFYRMVILSIRLKRLFSDGFDEVGLNQYMTLKKKNVIFDLNCAAIHPSYNSVGISYEEISDSFFEHFEN